jgi:myo-inositol-1(or 4)-monophosphatase
MHPYINTAITAARSAGKIIMRAYERLDIIKVSTKNPGDFVTNVDNEAETAIIETLQTAYRDHGFLAEESGLINADSKFQWIIDPLDGTTNFIHGFPHFCVSIALKIDNRIEHGVIYDPVRDDLFTASRGDGAQRNGFRIRVSKHKYLKNALIGIGSRPGMSEEELDRHYELIKLTAKAKADLRRAGSSALNLAYVASGQLDGCWKYGLQLWDMAAGVLMIKEAGGLVTDEKGTDNYLESGNIVTGNPKIFKELLKLFQ